MSESHPQSSSEPTTAPPGERWRIVVGLIFLVLVWGTTWAAIRINLEGFPPLKGLALRFAIAGAVLLVWGLVSGVRIRPERREVALWISQAVLTFSAAYGFIYWAEQWVPSGLVSVLFSTFPLWTLLWAWFLVPDERLGAWGWFGVLLGFGGVAVIFSEDLSALGGEQIRLAAGVVLLSPLASSLGNIAVKRWGKGIHAISLTAPPMLLTGILVGGVAMVMESERPIELSAAPVLALLYLAILGSAVTFTIYFWLLERVRVTSLSLITYAIPVVAVAVGTLALDEPLTLRIAIGAALVIAGVAFTLRRDS